MKFQIGELYTGYGLDEFNEPDFEDTILAIPIEFNEDTQLYRLKYSRNNGKGWNDNWKTREEILIKCKLRPLTKLEKALK